VSLSVIRQQSILKGVWASESYRPGIKCQLSHFDSCNLG
jgi:hypothetical protein